MSKLPNSLRRWLSCKRCKDLAEYRRSVIVGEGTLPCRVLLIGEGPGKTEDLLGEPFVGRSGQLLRQGMRDAAQLAGIDLPTHFITNVVACRPTDCWMGDNRPPSQEEVSRCMPRLARIVTVARPEAVVVLGDVAARECRKLVPDGVKIRHPAYVLRKGGIGSVDYRIFVRGFVTVFESLD